MGQISIEGMQFYAYHGVYEEERVIGNTFIVDVFINTDLSGAAAEDDIEDTINYETIYQICQAEMKRTVQLIETLIENIINRLKHQFETMQAIHIRVQKNRPIPGHRVSHSAVEVSDEFVKGCARCESPLICYGDEFCKCTGERSTRLRLDLVKRFGGCICDNCLSHFGA